MKIFANIMKIVAALAAVAGLVYVVATYGDKIVAWAKKTLKICAPCCCDEECCCEEGEECCCECACEEAPAEEAVEAPAEEAPVEEAAAEEVATEADFEA